MLNLEKINEKFNRVKIRQKNNSLFLRATFPDKENSQKTKQYEISLKCKANQKELLIAVAKAQEIESKLILEKWQWQEKEEIQQLTVGEAVTIFIEDYWQKYEKTINKAYNFKVFYLTAFGYLPEDKILNADLIIRAIKTHPTGSYSRQRFINAIKPLCHKFTIEVDFNQFGKYETKIKTLPNLFDIIESYHRENKVTKKWLIAVFFTYGLRPHEIFRSEFLFDQKIPVIKVGENTKTGQRTVYPLANPEIEYLNLDIPKFSSNLALPNTRLGHQIGKKFISYPFTVYDLRHYYAVRGASEGISPVVKSKWMGHSLTQHYKSYASLLNDIESEKIWLNKFD
jgi:integrase